MNIIDATANANASKYATFACSQRAAMPTDVDSVAGQINIYYVNRVDIGSSIATTNGNACEIGGNFVAMGSATRFELLVHETGHHFALQHVDGLASFDAENVMWAARSARILHERRDLPGACHADARAELDLRDAAR